ncbi:hypothetical protein DEJ25_15515 [Curtobacterium sp. MCPF17_011]|uniref:hypothetical protein n=1 Tax=Curtobacterium sp. MCPF17_011 TaxID=2175652 RepID=UPI000DAA450F|nr:hypothetical protein [Curtobacterium sp. MCPF17_011]PZF08994.1 hypothetical protein DEJ25_15515 [Curtobacterium sp. MCPF17_011]
MLDAAWILSVQFGYLWLSEPVIVALPGVLAWAFVVLGRTTPSGRVEAIVTDGTFGLHLGWVCGDGGEHGRGPVGSGLPGLGLGQDVWGVVVAAVAGLVGVLVAVTGRRRISPTLTLGWGLAWVAVARLDGPLARPARRGPARRRRESDRSTREICADLSLSRR